jgi:hypothetical protein
MVKKIILSFFAVVAISGMFLQAQASAPIKETVAGTISEDANLHQSFKFSIRQGWSIGTWVKTPSDLNKWLTSSSFKVVGQTNPDDKYTTPVDASFRYSDAGGFCDMNLEVDPQLQLAYTMECSGDMTGDIVNCNTINHTCNFVIR